MLLYIREGVDVLTPEAVAVSEVVPEPLLSRLVAEEKERERLRELTAERHLFVDVQVRQSPKAAVRY